MEALLSQRHSRREKYAACEAARDLDGTCGADWFVRVSVLLLLHRHSTSETLADADAVAPARDGVAALPRQSLELGVV